MKLKLTASLHHVLRRYESTVFSPCDYRNEMTPRFKGRSRKRKRPLAPSHAANIDDNAVEATPNAATVDPLKRRSAKSFLGAPVAAAPAIATSTAAANGNVAAGKKRKSQSLSQSGEDKKAFFCERRGCFVYDEDAVAAAAAAATAAAATSAKDRKSATPPRDENDADGKTTPTSAKKKKTSDSAPKVKKEVKEENSEAADGKESVSVAKVKKVG